jgi:regulator of cell morphogenesis and NO signaling
MNALAKKSLGEIVAADIRAAGIFTDARIDFCCGGKKTLEQACREQGVDLSVLVSSLESLSQQPPLRGQNFNEWDLDVLAGYISNTHHKFVLRALPELVFYTQKIASVHAQNHPELREVARLFSEIDRELRQHLQKEEEVLFPAIDRIVRTPKEDHELDRAIIHSEIERMNSEHEFAGGAMDHIHEITLDYQVPADGCNTYLVAFKMLREFEEDLHLHVHLENNILYPKALNL